jgi:hypothetical protein
MPFPFLIEEGRFIHLAITGYPLILPNEESSVLSAYIIKQNGFPSLESVD